MAHLLGADLVIATNDVKVFDLIFSDIASVPPEVCTEPYLGGQISFMATIETQLSSYGGGESNEVPIIFGTNTPNPGVDTANLRWPSDSGTPLPIYGAGFMQNGVSFFDTPYVGWRISTSNPQSGTYHLERVNSDGAGAIIPLSGVVCQPYFNNSSAGLYWRTRGGYTARVNPGDPVQVAFYGAAYGGTMEATPSFRTSVHYYNASFSQVSIDQGTFPYTPATETYSLVSRTSTAPAGAYICYVSIGDLYVNGSTVGDRYTFVVDDVSVQVGAGSEPEPDPDPDDPNVPSAWSSWIYVTTDYDPEGEPPPSSGARQLIGTTIGTSGASWNPSATWSGYEEGERLADLFGWPNSGPPVFRIFRQTQGPPYTSISQTVADSRVPWVSHKPPSGGVAADRAGANDAHWAAWGNYYKDFYPNKVIFTYDHEHDRHTHSGDNNVTSAGWLSYQADWREAFRRIKSVMVAADTTNGLSHVTFAGIQTGWAYMPASNRDPGISWHPDFDMWASDPYSGWKPNVGAGGTKRHLWHTGTSINARPYYMYCSDPVEWYETYKPSWLTPGGYQAAALPLANLSRFPTRMALGEFGNTYDHTFNGSLNRFVPNEPDDENSWMAQWAKQLFLDVRNNMPRLEALCYYHTSVNPPASDPDGHFYVFAGPYSNRYGAEYEGVIAEWATGSSHANHTGSLTPWTPSGLA